MKDDYQEVPVAKLKIGSVMRHAILERDQVLLLNEGAVITERVIALLLRRGIETVRLHNADVSGATVPAEEEEQAPVPAEPVSKFYRKLEANDGKASTKRTIRFQTAASRRLDEELGDRAELAREPGEGRVHVHSRYVSSPERWHEQLAEHEAREADLVAQVETVLERWISRQKFDPDPLLRISERLVTALGRDPDLACTIVRAPSDTPYPALHSLLVAKLSIAVAAYLDWSREEVLAIGMGALCHDIGMLRLPERMYRSRSRITSLERLDLVKHPAYSLDLLGAEHELHNYVRFIVYQTHERCDGSGYPRERTTAAIHPAARITGLVDSFVARISARPHRRPLLPHLAILEIAQETQQGVWDPSATKGLLRAVSLYPLGSFVELSNGRLARAIQTAERNHARPVLESWVDPAGITLAPGEIIDWNSNTRLSILRAVSAPQMI